MATHITRHNRKPGQYGSGPDAQRIAHYCQDNPELSYTFCYLRDHRGDVRKKMLSNLMREVVAKTGPGSPLTRLSRDQRRVKGGLLQWFDQNIAIVQVVLGAPKHY
jgi:hypothetical protein